MKRMFFIVILALALLYAGDYLSLRYQIPRGRAQYGVVNIQSYYAVGLKSGKTEFMFLGPKNQACVHSLFPHFGDSPCWYLNRKKVQRINM